MTLPKLVLPTFLGIGAPRSGSSWLHDLLAAHEAIVMPKNRKELDFFTANFDRGPGWYASYFDLSGRELITSVGEISPTYLYHPEIIPRIKSLRSISRFLVILRNPIDRTYSDYAHRRRLVAYRGDFNSFLNDFPTISEGMYFKHLEPFLNEFGVESFLILIFEEAVRDPGGTKVALARFLGVSPEGFPSEAGRHQVNQARRPRARLIGPMHDRVTRFLRSRKLDIVVALGRKAGLEGILYRQGSGLAPITEETRGRLAPLFAADVGKLEALLGRPILPWDDMRAPGMRADTAQRRIPSRNDECRNG
jgi:Sulfotransferase domain